MDDEYKYLGNFSAVDPVYSRAMSCHTCKVTWTGCWDNFMCPQCGQGELPQSTPNPSAPSGGLSFGGHDPSPDNRERWDMSPDELGKNY